MAKHWLSIAVIKGLVGRAEGLVEKFPTTLYAKNALNSHADPIYK